MLVLAVVAAVGGADEAEVQVRSAVALILFPLLVLTLIYMRGDYRPRMRMIVLDGLATVTIAVSIAAMMTIALLVLFVPTLDPAPLVSRLWLFAVVYVSGGRILLALSQRRARRQGVLRHPALIIGGGFVGARLARRLADHPEYGLHPIGFLDSDPMPALEMFDRRAPILGGPDDLEDVVRETGATHVLVAFSNQPESRLVDIARRCERLGVELSVVPRLFDVVNERIEMEHIGGVPVISLRGTDPRNWQFAIKHGLDRVGAALALVLLSPLLIAVAIGVKLSSPGPVLYSQRRVGRDEREFDLLKFRSMRVAAEPNDFLPASGLAPGGVEGSDRRTALGRFLRESSIDELPQLLNVLRGEMSLIGPRPERPEYVALFAEEFDRYGERHRVRAGLTGWAQVHGYRGQTSLADRVEWDNYYIENWSLWLDFKIALMTVWTVLRGYEGA
jgi:exopolysaccharide biosynthesis polyprenyl glycosylphosphotransferase